MTSKALERECPAVAPSSRSACKCAHIEAMSVQLPEASVGELTAAEHIQAILFFDFCVGNSTRDHIVEDVSARSRWL